MNRHSDNLNAVGEKLKRLEKKMKRVIWVSLVAWSLCVVLFCFVYFGMYSLVPFWLYASVATIALPFLLLFILVSFVSVVGMISKISKLVELEKKLKSLEGE